MLMFVMIGLYGGLLVATLLYLRKLARLQQKTKIPIKKKFASARKNKNNLEQ